MRLLVKEVPLDGSRHLRKWSVDIDCGEEFNYRGRTSSNAFFFHGKNRNRTDTMLYYGQSLDEALAVNEAMIENGSTGYDLDNLEEVESIWKFYEIIGYDYKKKKFTS